VTKLRAILLIEADFNANNKIIFGERMIDVVHQYGLMEDEVFSEQGRMAEDGALSKVLFYNIVHQFRLSAVIIVQWMHRTVTTASHMLSLP
jgi:hypothetical protein